jgi:hypothetical protein
MPVFSVKGKQTLRFVKSQTILLEGTSSCIYHPKTLLLKRNKICENKKRGREQSRPPLSGVAITMDDFAQMRVNLFFFFLLGVLHGPHKNYCFI